GPAQAVNVRSLSAESVAQCAPYGTRNIKPGQHAHSCLDRIKIGDDGGRRRPITGLTDDDKQSRAQQDREGRRQSRPAAGQTPHRDTDSYQYPTRKTISQPAEDGRGAHVTDQKRRCPKAGFAILVWIACEELLLKGRQDREENVTVDVIKKVDGEQECQSGAGARFLLVRHNAIAE